MVILYPSVVLVFSVASDPSRKDDTGQLVPSIRHLHDTSLTENEYRIRFLPPRQVPEVRSLPELVTVGKEPARERVNLALLSFLTPAVSERQGTHNMF